MLDSCKWILGDPTSSIAIVCFPNRTFYRGILHHTFERAEYEDGGFMCSIADDHLTWDPTEGVWKVVINANGWITESSSVSFSPDIPFAPTYGSKQGRISDNFLSFIDVCCAHADGHTIFTQRKSIIVQNVRSPKHTWSGGIPADTISAYVCSSTFLPTLPLPPRYSPGSRHGKMTVTRSTPCDTR